ncbi:gamma-glutamyl-gamma-aminobutyrate hydrolase family protein [Aneurinibacillus aneurinilyticus]|uniref:gamma-glutamyl-gamma-aminobutyrate hydrolase family protein n=1 Tax=Aneurinibacillus aneurinilyticus TaxID=1391 RepID=UPI0036734213
MSNTYKTLGKPLIGITTWRRDLPTFLGERTDLYTLGPEYVESIEKAGGIAILLPHTQPKIALAYLDLIDGLLVSGGGDVDPESYGDKNSGQSYEVNAGADAFEIALVQEARKRKIPTLGICRGFQILQVAFEGTMLQDLHEAFPLHPKNEGAPEYILSQNHKVLLEKDSILAQVYNCSIRTVNTIHHQCIQTIGKGFIPVGWSEDGIIEAVQSSTDWLALGMQWHPEKLEDEKEYALFSYFIKEVEKRIKKEEPMC